MTRREFEQFVSSPPFERNTALWPCDSENCAWPGQYRDIAVQLAWEVLQEAERRAISKAADLEKYNEDSREIPMKEADSKKLGIILHEHEGWVARSLGGGTLIYCPTGEEVDRYFRQISREEFLAYRAGYEKGFAIARRS